MSPSGRRSTGWSQRYRIRESRARTPGSFLKAGTTLGVMKRREAKESSAPTDEVPGWRRLAVAWWPAVKVALHIILPVAVVAVVWKELSSIDIRSTRAELSNAKPGPLLYGLGCTVASLAVMGLYDVLAFRNTPALTRRHRWRLGVAIFAWTNFLTLGPIGGPALRLYFYRRAGMETGAVVRGLSSMYTGMFGGLIAWLTAVFLPLGDRPWTYPARLAVALLIAPLVAKGAGMLLRRVKRLGIEADANPPLGRLSLVSVVDWMGFYATFVLTAHAVGLVQPVLSLVKAVLLGHIAGAASMIPGGIGGADVVWMSLGIKQGVSPNVAAAHVVLFRTVFYILPWAVSLLALYIVFAGRWGPAIRWQRRILAGAVVLNAAFLLGSAATPAIHTRLRFVDAFVPLGAQEASHGVAVLAAAIMLFLFRGLLRGYRSAFLIAGAALGASVIAHLLKGADFEESIVSLVMLILLLGARKAFRRSGRVPMGWELTAAAAVGSVAFFLIVGLVAFRRIPDDTNLWLTSHEQWARFLRGAAVLGGVALAFVVRQAVMPVRMRVYAPPEEIDLCTAFIRKYGDRASPLNVACGDKAVWRWQDRGLVLYQRHGDKMIVLGDPVLRDAGEEDDCLAALHTFALDEDLDLTFYQVSGKLLEHLHDFGYTFYKLGEEALVPIAGYSLNEPAKHALRKTTRRVEAVGVAFDVLAPPHPSSVIDQAREISDAWLEEKGVREMQFSVGYFSPEYLQRFPLGVCRGPDGTMLSFANLMGARPGTEMTFDLMRYRPGSVDGLMEYMVVRVCQWGADQGYSTLNLGMSPLFEVGEHKRANLTERLSRLIYEHGERVYNYRGLQTFKNKFKPVWEPRFMAYQRPWDWPSAILAATSLIRVGSRESRERIGAARLGGAAAGPSPVGPGESGSPVSATGESARASPNQLSASS